MQHKGLILSIFALIFCLFSLTSFADPQPTAEKYQFPPLKKGTANTFRSWDGYCPPCTLENKAQCQKLPCQTHNLKPTNLYENIEVSGDKWAKLANEERLNPPSSAAPPFGAVIVQIDDKSGRVFRYWVDHNHSVDWHDPTAHAEMSVIRKAARELNVTDLGHIRKEDSKLSQPSEWSHCVIYSSAEPCPMCMAAIYWAGIHYLVFSATRYDTAAPGVNWDETAVFEELKRPYAKMKTITVRQATTNNFLDGFNYYKRTFIKK